MSPQDGFITTSHQPALSCISSDAEARTDTDVRTDAESSDSVDSTLAQALNALASRGVLTSVTTPAQLPLPDQRTLLSFPL